MIKLTLNKAAKEAGAAKSTILDALNSGRMSAAKNDKGHWQIDPAELFRVFPRTGSEGQEEPKPTPAKEPEKPSQNNGLEVEVKMLREQIDRLDMERERERLQLNEQIEVLKEQAERQSADHRQALAALTDQRGKDVEPPRRSWFARLVG